MLSLLPSSTDYTGGILRLGERYEGLRGIADSSEQRFPNFFCCCSNWRRLCLPGYIAPPPFLVSLTTLLLPVLLSWFSCHLLLSFPALFRPPPKPWLAQRPRMVAANLGNHSLHQQKTSQHHIMSSSAAPTKSESSDNIIALSQFSKRIGLKHLLASVPVDG